MVKNILDIVFFLDFPFMFGGASGNLLQQAKLMNRNGHRVTVVIPTEENGSYLAEFEEKCIQLGLNNYTFLYYEKSWNMAYTDIMKVFDCYQNILCFLKEIKTDIIISVQLNPAVEFAARTLGIPHIMNAYQIEKDWFEIKWLDIYSHFHLCDSLLYSEIWKKGLRITSDCIRNACDLNLSNTKREQHKKIRIISIGSIAPRKNQFIVIKAVEMLIKNEIAVTYDIFGYDIGAYADMCKNYVTDNSLDNVIRFNGFQSNIKCILDNADVLICSSLEESYPMSITEAMSADIPVITTPVAGVPELLTDGLNAYMTEGFTEKEIYETILRFINDYKNNDVQAIVEKAHETWKMNHSPDIVCKQLLKYYNKVIELNNKAEINITIDSIKMQLNNYIINLINNKDNLLDAKFTQRYLWYFYHILHIKKADIKKISIWGAGYFGSLVKNSLDMLSNKDLVNYFIDSYQTGIYQGKDIIKYENVPNNEYIFVAVSVEKQSGIINILEKTGRKWNQDYFILI